MDDSEDGPGRRWGQRPDPAHEQVLLRELAMINERMLREFGPLSPGGLPVLPKRKLYTPRPAVPPVTLALHSSDENTTMQWKSVVTLAALATGSTLAACGAEGTTARVEPTMVAVPDVLVPAQSTTVDAAPPAAQVTAVEPAMPADSKASESVGDPAIPAAQLRRQILALLGSLLTLEDLERDNVERAFGVSFTRMKGMSEGYEYDGITFEGWQYGISTAKLSRLDQPSTIIVGMDYGFDYDNDLPPSYCTLAFEPLAKELVAMGYERSSRMSRRGGKPSWGFGRWSKANNASFGIGIYIYELEAMDGTTQACIKGFDIGGGVING